MSETTRGKRAGRRGRGPLWRPDEKCIRCELRDAVPGLRSCEECLGLLRSAKSGDQSGAIPAKECSRPGCRRPSAPGRMRCWRCLDQARPFLARAKAAANAAGDCPDCLKAKRAPGLSRCRGCIAKARGRQLDLNAWGHCNCGRALDGESAVLCRRCLARNAAYTRRWRAAGRDARRRRRRRECGLERQATGVGRVMATKQVITTVEKREGTYTLMKVGADLQVVFKARGTGCASMATANRLLAAGVAAVELCGMGPSADRM